MNNIIFAGDSFTWGEGLEFYQELPKWIDQRTKPSNYIEYMHLIDESDDLFRKSNRFAGLVGNKLNLTPIVAEENGGDFVSMITHIENNINSNTEFIILQIAMIHRMSMHLGLKDNQLCCDWCTLKGSPPISFYWDVMYKISINESLTNSDYKWIRTLSEYGLPNLDTILSLKDPYDIMIYFSDLFQNNINKLYTDWIKKWENYCPVYIIDSWDMDDTSDYLHNHSEMNKLLIPLKGYDNNYYTNYGIWERTFPHQRIQYEFPGTDNGHPTFIQHQYLAESIIEKINNHGR